MKLKISRIILYLMFFFPIGTVISSFPILGNVINKITYGILIVVLLYGILKTKVSKKNVWLLLLLVGVYIYDINVTTWPLYNSNEFFYLGTWVVFMIYVSSNYNLFKRELICSVKQMKWMVWIWELIVVISFVIPNCYQEGYFLSFAGSSHRMDSSAMMILAAILILYRYQNFKKRILLYLVIPSIAIALSGARTYIVLLGIILMAFYYYTNIKHTLRFYFTIIPIAIIAIGIVFSMPIMQQRVNVMQEEAEYFDAIGYNALTAVTSGRSTFWIIDLTQYWQSPILNRILGNGFNFVRYVNSVYYTAEIWAHNDFINIICCNGVLGLYLYFKTYLDLTKKEKKKSAKNKRLTILS